MFHNFKLSRTYDFMRYFFSYFIIYTVLIFGFFLIMRNNLTKNYFALQCEQASLQLKNISQKLDEDILHLTQIDSSIASNTTISSVRYHTDTKYFYRAYEELKIYVSTSNMISSIIYMPKNTCSVLSTQLHVTYNDDNFYITTQAGRIICFNPSSYYDSYSGQLILVSNAQTSYWIYFPPNALESNYVYFYILNSSSILDSLKSLTSPEMPVVVLLNNMGQYMAGQNFDKLSPHLGTFSLETGTYKQDASTSICVYENQKNSLFLVSMLSNDLLISQINTAFSNTYLLLSLLCITGFFLIFLSLNITYSPLHKLVQSLIPDYDTKHSYLNQLNTAFYEKESHNLLLKTKLEKYQLMIQKSLLNTLLASPYASSGTILPDIDSFFDTSINHKIYIIKIATSEGASLPENALQCVNDILPPDITCILLETEPNNSVYLVNFTGDTMDKDRTLKDFCEKIHKEKGYLTAISNSTDSPWDIPSLYEHVNHASSLWPLNPVAVFSSLPPVQTNYVYPHKQLNTLSVLLKENNFANAQALISELFTTLSLHFSEQNPMPAFFINCILIDLLTIIANNLLLSDINFDSYSDIYYETLYFCRSFTYIEKSDAIHQNIKELLAIYEEKQLKKMHETAPLIQLMEEHYCMPDFSISTLAEKCNLSVSRMSIYFKQELGIGFADYLWIMRLNKAKELLINTSMSVDEISIAVGYTNSSSFRRKFKQEMLITPSQFRADHMGTEDKS